MKMNQGDFSPRVLDATAPASKFVFMQSNI